MYKNTDTQQAEEGTEAHNHQHVVYQDDELVIINHLRYSPEMHSTQENYVFIVMCNQGKFKFLADNVEYNLTKNDVFIGHPNAIYSEYSMSHDLDCGIICIKKQLLFDMLYPHQSLWNRTLYIEKHNLLHMSEKQAQLHTHFNAMVMFNIDTDDDLFRKEIIRSLVQSCVYLLCRALNRQERELTINDTSQRRQLFDRFITMLNNIPIKKHSVLWYAEQLYVSSRYLTLACRDASNKTAYEWISEYVQNDVRYHLLHTNLTIKEIAIKLGFCNLSFFGKYVRENFGMSPTEFRKQI